MNTRDGAAVRSAAVVVDGPAPEDVCLLERLRAVVAAHSTDVAVVDGDREMTYRDVVSWAALVGDRLREAGIRRTDRVAVAGRRGADVIAGFLAVASIGATYVPLDEEYPRRRLEHMLDDSRARALLHAGEAPEFETSAASVPIPDPPPSEGTTAGWSPVGCAPDLPIYAIYTSGSTGWPKGVLIQHRCLDNMVSWQVADSPGRARRTAQFAPLNFDVFFQEVLGTLCGGGTVVVMPESLRRDPFRLLDWLAANRIERLFLPYAALQMLAVAASDGADLSALALLEVNCAGEQLVCTEAIRSFFARLPACRLCNHYGQSESAMVSSFVLEGRPESWPDLVPIGAPLPGCTVVVDPIDGIDPSLGELVVAGRPVSLGYIGDDRSTSERYVDVETASHGVLRAFRTGDVVRYEDGSLRFVGRMGDDVKHRGVRVNLGEVDAWLARQAGVREAAAVVVRTGAEGRALRAAVTLVDGVHDLDTGAVLADLRSVLPAVSVPVSIAVFPDLPRTPSGKIDRAAIATQIEQQ